MELLKQQVLQYKTYRGFINSDRTQAIINYYVEFWHPELVSKGWGVSRPALLKDYGYESFEQYFNSVHNS